MQRNNAVFITSRTESTRLPKKALLKLYDDVSLIEHIIKRAKFDANIKVILCTTTESADDMLVEIAKNNGINFFKGSTSDKLERCLGAAKEFDISHFATMDGDGIYGCWSVPYQEPLISSREFVNRDPELYQEISYKNGLCPVAEKIQPEIMQFKTNYRSLKLAKKKARALRDTIKKLKA